MARSTKRDAEPRRRGAWRSIERALVGFGIGLVLRVVERKVLRRVEGS